MSETIPQVEKITIPEGKVCDYIDGKLRNDTPEEYVRQNIEKRIVNELKYSPRNIKVEQTINLGARKPRADIAIYSPEAPSLSQDQIRVLIECKKENVSPKSKRDGVEQLKSYMAACPNCEWGMWTNGKEKFVYRRVYNEKGEVEYQEHIDIPPASGDVSEVERPTRNSLRTAVEDNLLFTFKNCHNHIYANDGMQKQPAFFELLKVIFCKIEDERNIPQELEFFATSKERSNPDGQLTVAKRIGKIFQRVKRKQRSIFNENEEIELSNRTLSYIVSELQTYSLLDTHIDIKGKAYEEIVGSNLRGDRGEFFTPRNVMEMAVKMVNPQPEEAVLDSSCGTGGFLVNAMNHVIKTLREDHEERSGKSKDQWGERERKAFYDKIDEIMASCFFGFDLNPDLVKATKMNMVMNNDGSGNIFRLNTLYHPHEWPVEVKEGIARARGVKTDSIRGRDTIGLFDVIVTNPPFGSKILIKDETILNQYDLGYIWEESNDGMTRTERLQSSVPPEVLFVERCHQLLRPGGRLAIVLPDSILGNPGYRYIRHWLMREAHIIASIDLHKDTFQPYNGTQTSILITQKKSVDEKQKEAASRKMEDRNIFMAIVDRVGHDKRGNPIFKRDEKGNILMEDTTIVGSMSDGTLKRTNSKSKIPDDQTVEVPKVFEEWKKNEGIPW